MCKLIFHKIVDLTEQISLRKNIKRSDVSNYFVLDEGNVKPKARTPILLKPMTRRQLWHYTISTQVKKILTNILA